MFLVLGLDQLDGDRVPGPQLGQGLDVGLETHRMARPPFPPKVGLDQLGQDLETSGAPGRRELGQAIGRRALARGPVGVEQPGRR